MANKEKVSQKVQEAIFAQLLNNPNNGQCADCHTASPNWVSLDFGVFICMQCSGVHRQLGPHISRVRSLKLDGWTRDNIEIMATVGNKIANDYYEYKMPTGYRRPSPNSSADECRRFIDEKYIKKSWIPQGFPEPVKDFVACREKGTKPDFSYSQQKQNKQQPVPQPVVQPEQPQSHHGLKFTRKKSASFDKAGDHHHDKKPAQPTHHPDLLTQDIDLLGSEPSDDNQGIHSASPPPKKINFANFKKAQSQPASHPLHHHQSVPDLTTTFPWGAQGEQQQQQGGNTAQAQPQTQPQENKVDVMKLYSQPQGHQNHFMQGMNPGWQQYGNWNGGMNQGYNMGHQNHFQGGYPQNYGAQQGFQQGGQNMGNMGYNPYMNYGNQQGHAQNQFGNNNGFVQAQGPNTFF